MKTIELNRHNYLVNDNEFNEYTIEKYCNLKLVKDLSKLELLVGLINDIGDMFTNDYTFVNDSYEYGGFVPINVNSKDKYCLNLSEEEKSYLIKNNFNSEIKFSLENINNKIIYYKNNKNSKSYINASVILSKENLNLPNYITINVNLDNKDNIHVCLPENDYNLFHEHFKYYINNEYKYVYTNLIQLVMIVKNAGDNFENILKENLPSFDRYTILDTGSTDNTVEIIKKTLVNKKGKVYQEPFINFRESRNRSLELAGNTCKFNLILDDTYVVKNNLREFLQTTRSDQFGDSYSLYIKSYDVVYCSNRITKSLTNLRYIYTIHEVITDQNNKNVMVPFDDSYVHDVMDKYMETRTYERKQLDIKLL